MFSSLPLSLLTPCAGQWSPIAGTVLGALGSLYLLWSTSDEDTTEQKRTTRCDHSNSSRHSHSSERCPSPHSPMSQRHSNSNTNLPVNVFGIRSESPNDIALVPTITHPGFDSDDVHETSHRDRQDGHPDNQPTAGRHKVRRWLTSAGNYLGDAAHEKLDLERRSTNEATRSFPEVPGEGLRNPDLASTSRSFYRIREAKANSIYAASIRSTSDIGASSPPPVPETPRLESSPAPPPKRRDTLEVPKETHRRSESHGSIK
jgi:hypothetical protein